MNLSAGSDCPLKKICLKKIQSPYWQIEVLPEEGLDFEITVIWCSYF